MKFAKLTAIALASVLTFSACKYEEGPRISLRTKRDRVANEWRIEKYEYQHKDSSNVEDRTSMINNPENGFTLILNFARTGGYSVEIVKAEKDDNGNTVYRSNHLLDFNKCCYTEFVAYRESLPSHFSYLFPGGKWTFDKGHYKIQVKPELSYDANEVLIQKNTIDWTIVKLAEKEMKVKGRDENDNEWKLHLKRINDEPFWY